MAKIKANCVCFIRRLVRAHSMSTEQIFLSHFTPEEIKLYQTLIPAAWVEEAYACKIGETGAAVMHPGDPNGLRYLSQALALNDFKGIYRALFAVATIPFVLKQAPILWKTYHDTGMIRTERPDNREKKILLLVTGYPGMLETWRELLCGYIQGIVEQTGGRNVKVSRDQADEGTWRWVVTWE